MPSQMIKWRLSGSTGRAVGNPHVEFAVGDTALARAGSSVRLGAISTREDLRYLDSLFQAKDAVIGQPRLFLMGDRHIALTFAFPSLCRAQKQITYAPSPCMLFRMLFPGYAPTHTAFLSIQRHRSFPNGSSKCSKPWRITLDSGDRILRSPFFSFLFTA